MKNRRSLILVSLFLIPLLSLGQDVSSITRDFSHVGANKLGSNASLENGIIIVLALMFFYEVYKFYLGQKKSREQEQAGVESEWN